MKIEKLYEVLGNINENHIKEAGQEKKAKKNVWPRWCSLVASFSVILLASIIAIPMFFDNENGTPSVENDYKYESGYFYNVDESAFSTYVGGKVISNDKINDKLSDVSVTAGWKNAAGEYTSTEKLRGEIYSISGVSNDVAVALKFLDKGEAVTTTHYYVIMNPKANLAPVAEYITLPIFFNNPEDEITAEIPE